MDDEVMKAEVIGDRVMTITTPEATYSVTGRTVSEREQWAKSLQRSPHLWNVTNFGGIRLAGEPLVLENTWAGVHGGLP